MAQSFTYAILEWARTKPADEAYDYADAQNCAVAQYGQYCGRDDLIGLDPFDFMDRFPLVERAANPDFPGPMTFGGFAKRLEEALAA